MQAHLFHVVLAICLVGGTWCVSHPVAHPGTDAPGNRLLPVAPITEGDAMDLRIGDSFWGLQLTGVVPCSKMLVKGGGDIVTLSLRNQGYARCIYHVVNEKQVELQGRTFRLRVIAPDQIHVERAPAQSAVVTNP